MAITKENAFKMLETLHKQGSEETYTDQVINGIPENYSGTLAVTHVDEDLSDVGDDGKKWWACDVRIDDGSIVKANVQKLIRLRGKWSSSKLSERASELEKAKFQIDKFEWTPDYSPKSNPSLKYTRKVLKGVKI